MKKQQAYLTSLHCRYNREYHQVTALTLAYNKVVKSIQYLLLENKQFRQQNLVYILTKPWWNVLGFILIPSCHRIQICSYQVIHFKLTTLNKVETSSVSLSNFPKQCSFATYTSVGGSFNLFSTYSLSLPKLQMSKKKSKTELQKEIFPIFTVLMSADRLCLSRNNGQGP